MERGVIMLEILSPEKKLFQGEVKLVRLPGGKAPFTVMCNHAPVITTLERGNISWEGKDGISRISIAGGFAEVADNRVTLCVETDI